MHARRRMCATDYALPHDEIAHAIDVTEMTSASDNPCMLVSPDISNILATIDVESTDEKT